MQADKRKRLEENGWVAGDASDFLNLSDAESRLIDIRISLANQLKQIRQQQKLSQAKLAKYLGSSQSRVAKMESCDSSVSMDMMFKAMVTLGASDSDIAKAIAPNKNKKKAAAKRTVSRPVRKAKKPPKPKAKRGSSVTRVRVA